VSSLSEGSALSNKDFGFSSLYKISMSNFSGTFLGGVGTAYFF
jgi:hypothetical protein